jgi:hypothetical protein
VSGSKAYLVEEFGERGVEALEGWGAAVCTDVWQRRGGAEAAA